MLSKEPKTMHKLPLLDLVLVRVIITNCLLLYNSLFQDLCNRENVCRSVKFNAWEVAGRIH